MNATARHSGRIKGLPVEVVIGTSAYLLTEAEARVLASSLARALEAIE